MIKIENGNILKLIRVYTKLEFDPQKKQEGKRKVIA